MTCQQARKAIGQAVDHREQPSPDLEAHLADCPACRAEHRHLAALSGLVAAAVQSAPAHSPVGPMIARARARARPPSFRAWHLAWAAVAVAAFLIGCTMRKVQTVEKIVQVPVYREKVVRINVPAAPLKAASTSSLVRPFLRGLPSIPSTRMVHLLLSISPLSPGVRSLLNVPHDVSRGLLGVPAPYALSTDHCITLARFSQGETCWGRSLTCPLPSSGVQ